MVMINKGKKDSDTPQMVTYNPEVDKAIMAFDSTLAVQYFLNPANEISPGEQAKIKNTYHDLFSLFRISEIEYKKMYDKFGKIPVFVSLAVFVLLLISQMYLSNRLLKMDKRESRVQFFGKNEKLRLFKFMQKIAFIVSMVFLAIVIVSQTLGLNDRQLFILMITTWAFMIFSTSVILPIIIARKTIKKCKESPMISEYFLSKYGRYMIRLEQFFNFVPAIILLVLMLILFKVPASILYPETTLQELRSDISKGIAAIDPGVLEKYPVSTELPVYDFAATRGQSLELKYSLSMEDRIKKSYAKLLNSNELDFNVIQIGLFIIFSITLLTLLINILPFEIAAKKYYRSS
jgi:hypothetical protein